MVDLSAADGRDPIDDIDKIDTELRRYSPELAERPQIMVANKVDSVPEDAEIRKLFEDTCRELGREFIFVSAYTGESLEELVAMAKEKLRLLPPLTVYESEYIPEEVALENSAGATETRVRREGDKYVVEGEWLYNFMGQINFSDYESMNFFQRVLAKRGVFDMLREAGIEEGDTVNMYDFEFDFVY